VSVAYLLDTCAGKKHVGNVKKAKVNTVGYSNIMNHYFDL